MKFLIDDLPVLFPYEFIYPEQHAYMKDLKRALDERVCGAHLGPLPAGNAFGDRKDNRIALADHRLPAILSR